MYREAIEKLRDWKAKDSRLPLVIRGARQVGKTWLVEEFGKSDFRNIVKVDFEKNPSMADAFTGDLDPRRIIRFLEVFSGETITPGDTLIFFDEIQEAPRALTSLKYFAEDTPMYHVIAAGSLLGIVEHEGVSFPVGKVSFIDLYPLSFREFLMALGEKGLVDLLSDDFAFMNHLHDRYAEKLREYMVVGGMPAVVEDWVRNHVTESMRTVQKDIIESYLADLSKHAPSDIPVRARQILMSIPAQLAKDNRKFMYSILKKGARARDYEESLLWLKSCRIMNAVERVLMPSIPLSAYNDESVFKLFMHDVGLLTALSGIDPKVIIEGNSVFDLLKGALTEQYVLQELLAAGWEAPSYYSNDKSTAEIDFLLEYNTWIIPLEVKAGVNTKAKSLASYREKYAPMLSLRSSLLPYKDQGWLVNIPLYAVSEIKRVCAEKLL